MLSADWTKDRKGCLGYVKSFVAMAVAGERAQPHSKTLS